LKQTEKKDIRAHSGSVATDAAEPEGHVSNYEPGKPDFKSNLIVFLKILAIGGGIFSLIWFLDRLATRA
jgi:hypothetical protein